MSKKEIVERYGMLVTGLFFMALGIAFCIRADLGITPISCPPYVLSLGLSPTVGQFTIAMHVVFVLLQVLILRKDFQKLQYMQVGIGVIFGFFVDFAVWLTGWMVPGIYLMKLLLVVAGSVLVAVGIVFQVSANVMFCAGEGLMLTLAKIWKQPFSRVKIGFDCTLIIISIIFSFILFGEIRGVREGTILSAFLVGFFVGKIQPRAGFLLRWLERHREAADDKTNYTVVTIAREYGSGGHEIGEGLARRLGWKFYDRQLINLTVEQGGLSTKYVESHDQRMTASRTLWKYISMDNLMPVDENLSPDDRLFVAQSKLVRDAVKEGPCVIVGRCADAILQEYPGCLRVFIYADRTFARERIARDLHLSMEEAGREIERINTLRANHYRYYTGKKWGDPANYDLSLKSSSLGIEGTVEAILSALAEGNVKNHQE